MPSLSYTSLRERAEPIKTGMWVQNAQGNRFVNDVQGAIQSTHLVLSVIFGVNIAQHARSERRLERGHGAWENESAQYNRRLAGDIGNRE